VSNSSILYFSQETNVLEALVQEPFERKGRRMRDLFALLGRKEEEEKKEERKGRWLSSRSTAIKAEGISP